MLKRIILLLLPFMGFIAKAQVVDLETQSYTNLGKYTAFYLDQTTKLGIDEVKDLNFQSKFSKGKDAVYNSGITSDAFWLRLIYRTATDKLNYVIFDQANLDTIKLYYRENGAYKELVSGSRAPLTMKSVKGTNFTFKLPQSGSVDTLYARITGRNALIVPVKVANGANLPSVLVTFHSMEAIYLGVFISFFFFNIFLFFSIGDRSILAYSFYILFLGLYNMVCLRGYSHLMGEDIKYFVSHYGFCLAALSSIFCISFTKLFLQLKHYSKPLCRGLTVMLVLWCLQIILTFLGYRTIATYLLQAFVLATTILVISAGTVALLKGFHPAKKYVLAFILFLTCTCYTVLCFIGVFPIYDFTLQVMSIGSTIEIVFLSFALAERIKALRYEKQLVEDANTRLVNERNDYLEKAVSEKTEALQVALTSLQTSNNMKDTLFNIVVHDMRSPLSNLVGLLNLKEENIISDRELRSYIGQTKEQVGIVQDRLSNLLLWSYTQMQNKPTEPEWINLKIFFEEQVKMYDRLMEGKGIEMQIRLGEHENVWGDIGSLAVIARNLLDNAVKYTADHGKILIGTEKLDTETKIFVANTGEITDEERFDILKSEHMKITQNVREGVGLGMILCKEFAARMNAVLEIEAKDGMTVFYLIIPNKAS